MSERERYPAGVPCWVETLQPDPQAGLDFYGRLFSWEFVGPGSMPGDPLGQYFVARLRGRDVAGIGTQRPQSRAFTPAWMTHIRVDSADEAADRAVGEGGSLRDGPFDVPSVGRMAILADPSGARFGVWEAGTREGAQVVNEPRAWALSVLETADLDSARRFYGAMFGWQPEPFGSQFTAWRLPGYVGGQPNQPVPRDVVGGMTQIGAGGSPSAGSARWTVEFWVDDTDAIADNATRHGGVVIVAPYNTPGFRNAVLADPQGAVFSISNLTAGPSHL